MNGVAWFLALPHTGGYICMNGYQVLSGWLEAHIAAQAAFQMFYR